VAAVIVAMIALLPATATGAARLLSSVPEDGDQLAELKLIEFDFDTLLLEAGTAVTVTRLDGTTFPVTDTEVDDTTLRATGPELLPSGNYAIGFIANSADGATNEGSIRISIEPPGDSFNGGLIIIIVFALAMGVFAGLVFRADKKRRPRSG